MAAGQTWDAGRYLRDARFVPELGLPVLELLASRRGERILDLGCGDGALMLKLAESGVRVVGVDTAASLLDAARGRGLDVVLADGENLPFTAEFDAVFSNAALHWMRRPERVIAGVRRALRPGGRFVGEFGGFGNVAAVRTALHAVLRAAGQDPAAQDPWYFPTATEYRQRLEAEGFTVQQIALIPRPTPVPSGLVAWLQLFAGSFLAVLPEAARAGALQDIESLLRPVLCDAAGVWHVDYVRLRFHASLGA